MHSPPDLLPLLLDSMGDCRRLNTIPAFRFLSTFQALTLESALERVDRNADASAVLPDDGSSNHSCTGNSPFALSKKSAGLGVNGFVKQISSLRSDATDVTSSRARLGPS